MSLNREVGADTKKPYAICQSFDLILKKKNKEIRKSSFQIKMIFLMAEMINKQEGFEECELVSYGCCKQVATKLVI